MGHTVPLILSTWWWGGGAGENKPKKHCFPFNKQSFYKSILLFYSKKLNPNTMKNSKIFTLCDGPLLEIAPILLIIGVLFSFLITSRI